MTEEMILVICRDGSFRSVKVAEMLNKYTDAGIVEFISAGSSVLAHEFGLHYKQVLEKNKNKKLIGIIVLVNDMLESFDDLFYDYKVPIIYRPVSEDLEGKEALEEINDAVYDLKQILKL